MSILSLLILFASLSAEAMYGDLLPLSAAPVHACRIDLGGGEVCSGTALSSTVIKTAAHCLRRRQKENVTVTCPGGPTITAVDLQSHPKHKDANDKRQYDVGLIFLARPALFSWSRTAWERAEILGLLSSSSCAVWSYGYNIESLWTVGNFHGVAIKEFTFEKNLVVLTDYPQVLIRGGDSGGGLFCLDDGQWINVATVYGHDHTQSFLLRNDFAKDFISKHTPLNGPPEELPTVAEWPEEKASIEVKTGQSYLVKPFSLFQLENGGVKGVGDQTQIFLEVEEVQNGQASGILIFKDFAPTRYLCDDIILCRHTYRGQRITISPDRLANP